MRAGICHCPLYSGVCICLKSALPVTCSCRILEEGQVGGISVSQPEHYKIVQSFGIKQWKQRQYTGIFPSVAQQACHCLPKNKTQKVTGKLNQGLQGHTLSWAWELSHLGSRYCLAQGHHEVRNHFSDCYPQTMPLSALP